jgi:hypothetical protein
MSVDDTAAVEDKIPVLHIAVLLLLLLDDVATGGVRVASKADVRLGNELGFVEAERPEPPTEAAEGPDLPALRDLPPVPRALVLVLFAPEGVVRVTAPLALEFRAPNRFLPNVDPAVEVDFFSVAYMSNTSFPAIEPLRRP